MTIPEKWPYPLEGEPGPPGSEGKPGEVSKAELGLKASIVEVVALEVKAHLEVVALQEKLAEKTLGGVSGWTDVRDKGAVPAVVVTDIKSENGSTTVESPGGHFTPAMQGQRFYLVHGGAVLVAGVDEWEAAPVIGTVTYVSATKLTLSVAAEQKLTAGEILIGVDATAAIQAAIETGAAYLPPACSFLTAGELVQKSKQVVFGGNTSTSRLVSVTKNANVLVSSWTKDILAYNFTILGNGYGTQPANVDPGENNAPNWSNAGCGMIVARAKEAWVSNVKTYFCGGNIVTEGRDGVAGIWVTMGCERCKFIDCGGKYSRSGINEDNYFGVNYTPFNNTYVRPITNYCGIGLGVQSGSLSRGCAVIDPVAEHCSIIGIEYHETSFVSLINPRVEFNGRGVTKGPGLWIHGNEGATGEYQQIDVINLQGNFNGTHGGKVSEFVTNYRFIGGTCSRNGIHGMYFNNKASHGRVDITCRDNGLESAGDGVHVTDSTDILLDGRFYDDQEGATQRWGIQCDGTSNEIVVSSNATFFGNLTGSVKLAGVESRVGALTRPEIALRAQGLKYETSQRASAQARFQVLTGEQRATLCGFQAGDLLTELFIEVCEAKATTLVELGIWSAAGALLAHTANVAASINTGTGPRGGALEAPFTIPSTGGYYLGWCMAGGTLPLILATTSGITGYSGAGVAGGAPVAVGNTAKAAIGALTIAASGTACWVGAK